MFGVVVIVTEFIAVMYSFTEWTVADDESDVVITCWHEFYINQHHSFPDPLWQHAVPSQEHLLLQ